MQYRCGSCGKQFELWECPSCEHDNTPPPHLRGHHADSHAESVKKVVRRILNRPNSEINSCIISALDISVPDPDDECLLPLPYVDEILAIFYGLDFLIREWEKTNRGWICYSIDSNRMEKLKNLELF